jgi:phospholipid/cholesterol/gamma-HCH transport system ATP-binding protein
MEKENTATLTDRKATTDEEIVVAKGVKKAFSGHQVLDGISFSLHRKENMVVLGKSGTGKSVLIKSLVGLVVPDAGSLQVLGKEIIGIDKDERLELRRKVGYLFQCGALYDSMTVKQNLEFPLQRQVEKISQGEMDDLVEESLENVGLAEAIHKMPAELSGGMQKRIALARTLILKPEIMLYDEPTTGLDPVTSREISELILEMREKFEISSIIITHDLSCTKITSDRICIIKEGKFGAEGTYDELEQSDDEWVQSFFKGY